MIKTDEYDFARLVYKSLPECSEVHSCHEAYANIKEHLDRFWHEILLRDSSTHKWTMVQELALIAATCCKAAVELELIEKNGYNANQFLPIQNQRQVKS